MPDIRVQDEQGTVHIFPDGSTPEMIAKAMGVKLPSVVPDAIFQVRRRVASIIPDQTFAQRLQSGGNPGSFEGHPENVGEYVPATAGNVASGVKDISQGNVARGTHKVISGAGNAFLPALPFMAAASPTAFAKIAAMGTGGAYLGSNTAEALGATPDQADVAGDVGGLAAGIFGPKALTATKGAIGDVLRTPYGPTSGASALKPGAKAVASIGKYVGGPELADWMVPERSAGPTGPYSKLPNRLPNSLRGDPFSPETSTVPSKSAALTAVPNQDVSVIPEPRAALPGDRPGAMWSVGREEILPEAAQRGAPGAGDVLRNIGQPIIYTPKEGVGYPGPRSSPYSPGVIPRGNPTPFSPVAATETAPESSVFAPDRRTSLRDVTGPNPMRNALMDQLRTRVASGDALAQQQLDDMIAHPFEQHEGGDISQMKAQRTLSKSEAEAATQKRLEGRNKRFGREQ